jgi:phosphomannomutase
MSSIKQSPIRFGTDGWRGLIADNFTFTRLGTVAPLAAQALADSFGSYFDPEHQASKTNQTVIIGYDRRFLSPEFANYTAKVVADAGFDVQLSQGFAPTPAFSWAAYNQKALGALVITASHNPAGYNGLKIKGAFGGSVSPDLTKQVEAKLDSRFSLPKVTAGKITLFDPWESYCQVLRSLVDIQAIKNQITSGELTVFADPMYGSASGGLAQILEMPIQELNNNSDPTFGGSAPEPLPRYLSALFRKVRSFHFAHPDKLSVGFVFDGDGDRIAAVDSKGNFLSSQILIPILIDHLAKNRGFTGEVIKTISGLNLIPKVAELYKLPVFETPIGYKYIAERMLSGIAKPLLGGEESGGIGYGTHIPERDALLSALYLLEAIATSKQDLSHIYKNLQARTGYTSHYDRIDKHLASNAVSQQVLQQLQTQPFTEINGRKVERINTVDGFKFELEDASWLLIRFSGTEPVLRLYCEAATPELVRQTLEWISDWVNKL